VKWYVSVFVKCSKQFHPSRNSANAYIVFTTEIAAEEALSLYVVMVYTVNTSILKVKNLPVYNTV